jgi:hypothetical protein
VRLYTDGSNPPDAILNKFITRSEETNGAIAVHCKAGLGRTGTCIGCYMMKHFRLTAEEIIGWLRIVRPGSIIGPQQQFMKEMQLKMWRDGELMRARLQQPTLENHHGGHGNHHQHHHGGGGGIALESERDDAAKAQASSALSPSSIASRHSNPNAAAAAAMSASAANVSAAAGRSPSTPNSLARRVGNMSISSSPPTSASTGSRTSASAAAVNASSGKAELEGKETQGDLLRMRRAQAMSNQSSPASASNSYANTPNGAAGTPSSLRSPGLAVAGSPSTRSYGTPSSFTPSSGTRPDSRGGLSVNSANSGGLVSPKADVSPKTAGTRSSIGNFLGFGK